MRERDPLDVLMGQRRVRVVPVPPVVGALGRNHRPSVVLLKMWGTPMTSDQWLFTLIIPRPCAYITMNMAGLRNNWRYGHSLKKEWYDATLWRAAQQRVRGQQPAAVLEWEFTFASNRRRDPDNYIPTRKPIVDALVRDLNLWPDDNPTYINNREPVLTYVKGCDETVTLRAFAR